MQDDAVLVVVEVTSVQDPDGLRSYSRRASELIGGFGGAVVAQGAIPVEGEDGFSPLVVQRWSSERAFRAWLASEVYEPLNRIRLASATMKVAIVPLVAGADA